MMKDLLNGMVYGKKNSERGISVEQKGRRACSSLFCARIERKSFILSLIMIKTNPGIESTMCADKEVSHGMGR